MTSIPHSTDATTAVHYSNVQGGWTGDGGNNMNQDPMFVSTELDAEDCRLSDDSPCINAASTEMLPDGIDTDLDGNDRVYGTTVDMGAYEAQTEGGGGGQACDSDMDGNGTVNFDDLVAVLTAWGSCSGCTEDVDGNGVVNFDDLVTVLTDWGSCP